MRRPEVRIEQVRRHGLDEEAVLRPHQVQLHLLGHHDAPRHQHLPVQRPRRHGPSAHPEPGLDRAQPRDEQLAREEGLQVVRPRCVAGNRAPKSFGSVSPKTRGVEGKRGLQILSLFSDDDIGGDGQEERTPERHIRISARTSADLIFVSSAIQTCCCSWCRGFSVCYGTGCPEKAEGVYKIILSQSIAMATRARRNREAKLNLKKDFIIDTALYSLLQGAIN